MFDFTMAGGTVRLDPTDHWEVRLPMSNSFLQGNLGSDRSAALHSVERGKTCPIRSLFRLPAPYSDQIFGILTPLESMSGVVRAARPAGRPSSAR